MEYIFFSQNGRVAFYSEKHQKKVVDAHKFNVDILDVTPEDMEKITSNEYHLLIRNHQLQFIEKEHVQFQRDKFTLKNKLLNRTATIEDIAPLLLKLL